MELVTSPEVRAAMNDARPIVALESTVIAHGLPAPDNLETARRLEDTVRANGAVPATIAVLDGKVHIGLIGAQLQRVAEACGMRKISVRDLGSVVAMGDSGATTVSSTIFLAARAGIRVFATGGIGGVHRWTPDVSADLSQLALTPIVVVCAGVKSILDVPATLERLETLGVVVLGYRSENFPGFYVTDSGQAVNFRVDDPGTVARIARTTWQMGLERAVVVGNAVPRNQAMDPMAHERILNDALRAADVAGVTGQAVTPFLLKQFAQASGGESVAVNKALLIANAALAAAIAVAIEQDAGPTGNTTG